MSSKGSIERITFYQLLRITENATSEELTQAYRQLARQHHPDRAKEDARAEATRVFQQLNEAYTTLSNPDSRVRYDFFLKHQSLWTSSPPIINEVVDLAEMEASFEDEQYHYSYPCRCGRDYLVSEFNLSQAFDIVPCSGCSLFIQVTYEANLEEEADDEENQ